MSAEDFFNLHRDLPRQGPGEAADVAWLGEQVDLPDDARIADLACGPGADIGPLLALAKGASVTAIDRQPQFIEEAHAKWGNDPRVDLLCGDMTEPGGPYDLIWCAGAVYILGVTKALNMWRSAMSSTGLIAFSQICFWDKHPPADLRDFWAQEYPAMSDIDGIDSWVQAAGYKTLATRRLSADAWESYYRPLEQRIARLQEDAEPDLLRVLENTKTEIKTYRQFGEHFGYLLSVVRPA